MGKANKTTRVLDYKTKMRYQNEANLNKPPLINLSLASSIDWTYSIFPLHKGPHK